ncbi:MAG TPA: DedA family protein [Candidatus Saccharimonadales bacterium]|jgi:membrane protein DedA with SNARE-associated domain
MHETAQHVPAFINALAPVVNQYGYLAVGGLITLEDFGVPAPGETVLIAAAFFAGLDGHLNIFLVALVAFVGAVIGDNIGFAIGQYGGHPLAERFGKYVFLTPARIAKVETFFSRHGGKVVAIARFVEGLRQANGIIAGLSEMRWPKFLAFNVLGAALWVSLWSTVGYFGGSHIGTFLRYQLYLTIAVAAALVLFIAYKLLHRRKA